MHTMLHRARKNNLHKIAIIFFSMSLNICFGCLKEPSNRDGSFEYLQHMFWLRNKKNNFQLRTLIWRPYWNEWKLEVHTMLTTHKVLSVFLLEYVHLLGQLWYLRPTLITCYEKQCGSRSAGFIRNQLIRIHPIFQN